MDQRIGANHARGSVRQAVTGRQLKPVHRVNTAWRIPSRVDSNDHPTLVEDIELRVDANAREYAPHGWLLDRRRLDRRPSPPHVNAHQFLTDAAHPVRMLVIAEASRLLLLLPCPPEQFHYGFGLEIFLAFELVAEVGDERRANGPIERRAGRGRIWHCEQVLVEPAHFAIAENADLNGGEDIRNADGASGDFGTACKYVDHALLCVAPVTRPVMDRYLGTSR